jgi:uncharacterized protein (DUF362 family)
LRDSVSRREFIRDAAIGTAAAALFAGASSCSASPVPPRVARTNHYMNNGKAILAVVEGTDINKMLEAGLDELGSLHPNGQPKSMAIKPNADSAHPYPVNIEMNLVSPLVRRMNDSGTKKIVVCDAPTTGMNKDRAFAGLGYYELEKQDGVKVIGGDAGAKSQFVSVRDNRWEASQSIGVFRPLHEALFVINVVVPKRHVAARFTCALKNHFGSVYGPLRWAVHAKAEEESAGTDLFDKTLVEFADAVRPELTIVDARSLLIKHGPKLRGRAEVKEHVNRLILCGDMVAADAYCADLMKEHDDTFDPEMIALQLEYGEKLGLETAQKSKIEVIEISV